MFDPFILFLAVAAAWFVLRLTLRRWSGQKVRSGDLSIRAWAAIDAGSLALMPLVAIPFITDADSRGVLLLIAVAIFVFQFVMLVFVRRFVERG